MELITVFASDDIEEIAIIKNILDKGDINYLVKNEYTQNLFGGVKPFSGHDPVAGSIQIQVREDDFDKCLQLIDENVIEEDVQDTSNEAVEEPENEVSEEPFMKKAKEQRALYLAQVLSVFSIFIVPYVINLFLLNKLKDNRKNLAIMLFIISTIMLIFGIKLFILK